MMDRLKLFNTLNDLKCKHNIHSYIKTDKTIITSYKDNYQWVEGSFWLYKCKHCNAEILRDKYNGWYMNRDKGE